MRTLRTLLLVAAVAWILVPAPASATWSIVAVDRTTGKVIAVGRQAQQMHGKTHENIKTIRPLRDGVIADFKAAEDMIKGMKNGAVIVDLAAERGGNCELSRPGETVRAHGVTIIGPINIAATLPHHASQMYGRNMENLLRHLLDDEGQLALDFEDEILAETVITHAGKIRAARILERLPAASAALHEEEMA